MRAFLEIALGVVASIAIWLGVKAGLYAGELQNRMRDVALNE